MIFFMKQFMFLFHIEMNFVSRDTLINVDIGHNSGLVMDGQ